MDGLPRSNASKQTNDNGRIAYAVFIFTFTMVKYKKIIYNMNNLKTITETDYVLYDRGNNSLYKDPYGRIIVFGDRKEAEADCHGNELVISCNQLPKDLLEELLTQINSN